VAVRPGWIGVRDRREDSMKRMNIGTAAILIVIVAFNLAYLRALPSLDFFLFVPLPGILLASLNLVLVQSLALRRPLGAFHLGFVGGGVLYSIATIGGRTRVIAGLIDLYRWLTDDGTAWRFVSEDQALYAEQALMLALGLLVCLASGVLASYAGHRLRARRQADPVATG
jgi:hypothetical protein